MIIIIIECLLLLLLLSTCTAPGTMQECTLEREAISFPFQIGDLRPREVK